MLEAIVWGVIQGITEFLPISSDGHLVLVPAFLKIEPPDLATSALLHLGTLLAVIAYFRQDLVALGRSRSNPNARRLLILLVIGSVPAAAALLVIDLVSDLQQSASATASFLIITGLVMALVGRLPRGRRTIDDMQPADALLIGVAQLLAVLPGISRSGFTIATGLGQRIDKLEAARFSFLLGIPAVAAAGLLEMRSLLATGGIPAAAWVGVGVAAITGYLAIAFFLRVLARTGLGVFAVYCLVVGITALLVL